MVAGRPESSGSCGMRGVYASSVTLMGSSSSQRSTQRNGYSPRISLWAKRGSPAVVLGWKPWLSAYGGWRRDSKTRVSTLLPCLTATLKKP